MTFGMMYVLGIDLQQVSIATSHHRAGPACRRSRCRGRLDQMLPGGLPSAGDRVVAWSHETSARHSVCHDHEYRGVRPFLLLTGTTGEFLFSLPVVMTCALVSSRIVSMTFIPMLGYYLLRPSKKSEKTPEERRTQGFSGFYYHVGQPAIEHRWKVFAGSLVFLVLGGYLGHQLKTQFFPDDVQYLSFLDIWLPTDAPLFVTNQTATRVQEAVRATTEKYGREHPGKDGQPRRVLKSLTTFVGGGGPRFWFSVTPQLSNPITLRWSSNYSIKKTHQNLSGRFKRQFRKA